MMQRKWNYFLILLLHVNWCYKFWMQLQTGNYPTQSLLQKYLGKFFKHILTGKRLLDFHDIIHSLNLFSLQCIIHTMPLLSQCMEEKAQYILKISIKEAMQNSQAQKLITETVTILSTYWVSAQTHIIFAKSQAARLPFKQASWLKNEIIKEFY